MAASDNIPNPPHAENANFDTDIEKVTQMAIDSGADIILTTEKDAVKMMPISAIPLYILKIEMNFSGCGETVIKNLITSLK